MDNEQHFAEIHQEIKSGKYFVLIITGCDPEWKRTRKGVLYFSDGLYRYAAGDSGKSATEFDTEKDAYDAYMLYRDRFPNESSRMIKKIFE